ncbi:zinc finger protein 600-like [Melanaphis sacchari]|uniref:Zinc finger protein 480 n=1 Tax=Melanaphis sacchari TaxID=742174 RepID=A0A2H8TTW6_9HEMI|nr:zinc finger protein 600-like [Melanaphis sacchari]
MGIKDDFVSNIIRNEIRYRKKEKKTKDAATITYSSKIALNDEEFTLLLKKMVKKLKKKKKKSNKVQLKNGKTFNCTKDEEVKCNICKQLFSKTYFAIHTQSHKALYNCDICDKNFSYLSIFNRHKATHKGDVVVYECKLCDSTFNNSSDLSKHGIFHEEESIICQFCFKKFKKFDDFLNHINIYSFDKPYQSLTNHVKMLSEGTHCSSCCTCKMSFAKRDTVIKYII